MTKKLMGWMGKAQLRTLLHHRSADAFTDALGQRFGGVAAIYPADDRTSAVISVTRRPMADAHAKEMEYRIAAFVDGFVEGLRASSSRGE